MKYLTEALRYNRSVRSIDFSGGKNAIHFVDAKNILEMLKTNRTITDIKFATNYKQLEITQIDERLKENRDREIKLNNRLDEIIRVHLSSKLETLKTTRVSEGKKKLDDKKITLILRNVVADILFTDCTREQKLAFGETGLLTPPKHSYILPDNTTSIYNIDLSRIFDHTKASVQNYVNECIRQKNQPLENIKILLDKIIEKCFSSKLETLNTTRVSEGKKKLDAEKITPILRSVVADILFTEYDKKEDIFKNYTREQKVAFGETGSLTHPTDQKNLITKSADIINNLDLDLLKIFDHTKDSVQDYVNECIKQKDQSVEKVDEPSANADEKHSKKNGLDIRQKLTKTSHSMNKRLKDLTKSSNTGKLNIASNDIEKKEDAQSSYVRSASPQASTSNSRGVVSIGK